MHYEGEKAERGIAEGGMHSGASLKRLYAGDSRDIWTRNVVLLGNKMPDQCELRPNMAKGYSCPG